MLCAKSRRDGGESRESQRESQRGLGDCNVSEAAGCYNRRRFQSVDWQARGSVGARGAFIRATSIPRHNGPSQAATPPSLHRWYPALLSRCHGRHRHCCRCRGQRPLSIRYDWHWLALRASPSHTPMHQLRRVQRSRQVLARACCAPAALNCNARLHAW